MLEEQGFAAAKGFDEPFAGYRMLFGNAWRRPVQGTEFSSAAVATLTLSWIGNHLDDLVQQCRAAVPEGQVFRSEQWDAVQAAAGMLRQGLPCGELRGEHGETMPASPEVVLNAAWLVKLHDLSAVADQLGITLSDSSGIQDISKVSEVLDRLALKSIEIASFLSQQ